MNTPFGISYAADQHYSSTFTAFVPTYEAAKQISALAMRLVNFFAFNSSAATIYLWVGDSADAGVTTVRAWLYVIPAGSYVSVSVHGGDRCMKGLYVKPFTDTGFSAAAGSVMFYKADWIDNV